MDNMRLKRLEEARLKCKECGRVYFIPLEMLDLSEHLEMFCKTCNIPIPLVHHSLKEEMRKELMDIIEKSTYQFLDEPPIKMAAKKMEKESK